MVYHQDTRFKRLHLHLILTSCLALSFLDNPSWAATLDAESITRQIRQAKLFKEDIPIEAEIQAPKVILWTPVKPSRSERDVKIDSILLAKAVMDLHCPNIARVDVRYYANGDKTTWKEVSITAGDIQAYGAGKESTDLLLNSLEINPNHVLPTLSTDYSMQCKQTMQFGFLLAQARILLFLEQSDKDTRVYQTAFNEAYMDGEAGRADDERGVIELLKRERVDKYLGANKLGNPTTGTLENDPQNWRGFIKPLEYKIEKQLGPGNIPKPGKWLGRRVMIAAKLKEIEEEGGNVADLRKRLKALEQPANNWDDSIDSQIHELDEMVDQLHEQTVRHAPSNAAPHSRQPK